MKDGKPKKLRNKRERAKREPVSRDWKFYNFDIIVNIWLIEMTNEYQLIYQIYSSHNKTNTKIVSTKRSINCTIKNLIQNSLKLQNLTTFSKSKLNPKIKRNPSQGWNRSFPLQFPKGMCLSQLNSLNSLDNSRILWVMWGQAVVIHMFYWKTFKNRVKHID